MEFCEAKSTKTSHYSPVIKLTSHYLLDFGRNVLGIKYQDEMKFNCLIFNHKYI